MVPAEQTRKFFDIFLAEKPNDLFFYLWMFDKAGKKRTYWYTSVDEAMPDIARKHALDIYIGMGLSSEDKGPYQRVTNDDAAGIFCVHADIDYVVEGHHKKGAEHLPQSEIEALGVLDTVPSPTMIVHSGGGLHCYWMFDQPWIFANDAERSEAYDLTTRWCKLLQINAKELGFEIDSTGDLARVLRVPGTTNWKDRDNAKAVELQTVEIYDNHPVRYNVAELREICKDVQSISTPQKNATSASTARQTHNAEHVTTVTTKLNTGSLLLDDKASPPFDKIELLQKDGKFKKTWENRRRDLRDSSSSGYEMALINQGLIAGWSDQEVVDLVIAWRRKHAIIPTLRENAQHYFEHTLRRAHAVINITSIPEDIAGDPVLTRLEKLDTLRAMLNVEILHIFKYTSDPPAYALITPDGEIYTEETKDIITQSAFKVLVAAATGQLIPSYDKDRWEVIARMLLSVCEPVDAKEATIMGIVADWLDAYLAESQIMTEDLDHAIQQSLPIRKKDVVHIFMNDFRRWLKLSNESIPEPRKLVHMLTKFGAYAKTIAYNGNDGKRTSRTAWLLPDRTEAAPVDDDEVE